MINKCCWFFLLGFEFEKQTQRINWDADWKAKDSSRCKLFNYKHHFPLLPLHTLPILSPLPTLPTYPPYLPYPHYPTTHLIQLIYAAIIYINIGEK